MDNMISVVSSMVLEAERHADDLSEDRVRATEYYRGEMRDTPSDAGRSQMVTRDVRAHIKKALPSIVRTILGGDEVVEFLPGGEGDEEGANQAADYLNYVVMPECDVKQSIYDAVHDALLLRNGILKWWYEEKPQVKFSRHSGLTEDALALLVADDSVEVVEHTEDAEQVGEQVIPVHTVQIKRTETKGRIRVSCVPRERFLIHPDALSLEDSLLVGDKMEMRRGDLIAMGYDKEMVMNLPVAQEEEYEETVRREDERGSTYGTGDADEPSHVNDPIDYYEVFVRVDMDDDGVSELRHMCFAGGVREQNLLRNEEVDEIQYCDIAVMHQPHQWEGISLADDLMDIQRAKTVLFRQTLDNLYWQNNPQPIADVGSIQNPEALFNPEFGLPIVVKQGHDVKDIVNFYQVPFVANESYGMLEYMDKEAHDRTGISEASAGMAPDALQNMTAKASAMIEQAGIGQTEFMVKTVADGLRKFFRGLLKMTIRHQDMPRTVRLRDEWVMFDPRHWNADMDCVVNTGLGAGTRERDMMMMQLVMGAQEKLLAGFGPDNPFVKPDNVWSALSKFVESAGLKTPAMYFTEPDPAEIEQLMQAMRNKPDPEQMKLQGQMQIEQAKLQAGMQMKQAEMQANRDKEMAQMEADLKVKEADRVAKIEEAKLTIEADAVKHAQDAELERERLSHDAGMKREEMAFGAQIEAIKAGAPETDATPGDNQGQFEALASAMIQASTAPKRIVRDENGDVVGVESVLN